MYTQQHGRIHIAYPKGADQQVAQQKAEGVIVKVEGGGTKRSEEPAKIASNIY
jgi:hypothetical protein